ncbi:hypothetical protein CLU79DRAFT_215083 [Phycomyces nitens]|nr:hypothetical protein CLU79DRAFT_215083 [Phycomyces nitens]
MRDTSGDGHVSCTVAIATLYFSHTHTHTKGMDPYCHLSRLLSKNNVNKPLLTTFFFSFFFFFCPSPSWPLYFEFDLCFKVKLLLLFFFFFFFYKSPMSNSVASTPGVQDINFNNFLAYNASETTSKRKKLSEQNCCFHCQKAQLSCDGCRPCQRCIKRDLANSCTDLLRKKPKYTQDTKGSALSGYSFPTAVTEALQSMGKQTTKCFTFCILAG